MSNYISKKPKSIQVLLLYILIATTICIGVFTLLTFADSSQGKDNIQLIFTINKNTYMSGDNKKDLDTAPIIENGRTLIPFRNIFEEFGYTLKWLNNERKIIATNDGSTFELWIDKNTATVNGKEVTLDIAPKIYNGRTLVPLRFISENIGSTVNWDSNKREIYIYKINYFKNNSNFSPSGERVLFKGINQKYYLYTREGLLLKLLGSFEKISWLDPASFCVEDSTGKFVMDLNGNKKSISQKPIYKGMTLDGNSILEDDSVLYYYNDISDLKKLPIEFAFNEKPKYIIAKTIRGPFVIVPEGRDEVYLKITGSSEPIVLGKSSLLVNKNGQIGDALFNTSIFFNDAGTNLALYQRNEKNITLKVFDLLNENALKTATIPFVTNSQLQNNKLDTEWLTLDSMRIKTTNITWNIKIGTELGISASLNNINQIDMGSAMIYYKTPNEDNTFNITTGKNNLIYPANNINIKDWYTLKGKIIASTQDSSSNITGLIMFDNTGYKVILEKFKIQDIIKYNDNLLIYGIDASNATIGKKLNQLFRFDGTNLKSVSDNFYISKYTEFKDRLIINKYDSNLNYSLIKFDKTSADPWTPLSIKDDFKVDSFIAGNLNLYMYGSWKDKSYKTILSYEPITNNTSTCLTNNSKENNLIFSPENLFEFSGHLFGIKNSSLYFIGSEDSSIQNILGISNASQEYTEVGFSGQISDSESNEVNTQKSSLSNNLSNSLKSASNDSLTNLLNQKNALERIKISPRIEKYAILNNKLYLATSQTAYSYWYKSTSDKNITIKKEVIKSYSKDRIFTIDSALSNLVLKKDSFSCRYFNLMSEHILALGKDTNTKIDNIFLVYDNQGNEASTPYILTVQDTLPFNDKMLINVSNIDNITNAKEDSILINDKNTISNLAPACSTSKWSLVNDTVIFSLTDQSTNTKKLCSYTPSTGKFSTVINDYNVSYWNTISNTLFTSYYFTNNKENKYTFLKFTTKTPTEILKDFMVENILAIKSPYYLVYGTDMRDKDNIKRLYIYNENDNSMTLFNNNIKIYKMLFIQ